MNLPKPLRPIRFGILCDSLMWQAWQVECVNVLLDTPETSLVLIVQKTGIRVEDSREGLSQKRMGNSKRLLYSIYKRFCINPAAYTKIDMSERLRDVPVRQCEVTQKGQYARYFSETDVAAIRQQDLDFILLFGIGIIRGEILEAARYGVWSFHHDDELKYRGLPSCFWEIYYGDRVTGAILQRLTERLDGGIILKKGYFRTVQHSLSKNKDNVYFGSCIWPAEVVQDIRSGICTYLEAPPSKTEAPIFRRPESWQTLVFVARLMKNKLRHLFHVLFLYQQWNIGIADAPISDFLKEEPPPIHWFPHLPRDTFYADPFGLKSGSRVYVLFEEYKYASKKGRISVIELGNSSSSRTEIALEKPGHLSYPYLIEYEDEIYCIPESPEVREVVLYKAIEFPTKWKKETVILEDFAGVDTTVFQYKGRWWLFCTNRDYNGANSRLYIFYAAALKGPWQPHRANPVKMDVRSSRPGGTPFMHNGNLYRPAQDSSLSYGGGLSLNRVTKLTPDEFQEDVAAYLKPDPQGPYREGIHTLATLGDKTLVDGKRYVYSFRLIKDLSETLMRRKERAR